MIITIGHLVSSIQTHFCTKIQVLLLKVFGWLEITIKGLVLWCLPLGYLDRIMALFSSPGRILHLFSGGLKRMDFSPDLDITLVDIWPHTVDTLVMDATNLSFHFPGGYFDLILADPPYTRKDAERYGTPMPNKAKVVRECAKVIKVGGYLVWLDVFWPIYRKAEWRLEGTICLLRSTNRRVRGIFIFRRL